MTTSVTSACPSCGQVAERATYDIGSGPELSCANCEWCWGAEGQPLKPLHDAYAHIKAGGFGVPAPGCPACDSSP